VRLDRSAPLTFPISPSASLDRPHTRTATPAASRPPVLVSQTNRVCGGSRSHLAKRNTRGKLRCAGDAYITYSKSRQLQNLLLVERPRVDSYVENDSLATKRSSHLTGREQSSIRRGRSGLACRSTRNEQQRRRRKSADTNTPGDAHPRHATGDPLTLLSPLRVTVPNARLASGCIGEHSPRRCLLRC
jgi:hypothetical protein